MGHRMELYVPQALAQDIISISEGLGVEAKIIGRVEASSGSKTVTIEGPYGTFTYT